MQESKLTPETQSTILSFTRRGNYLQTTAAVVGVSYECIRLWMQRGKRERRGKYRAFADALYQARAQAEVLQVAAIARAAGRSPANWCAAAWILERTRRKRWSDLAHYDPLLP